MPLSASILEVLFGVFTSCVIKSTVNAAAECHPLQGSLADTPVTHWIWQRAGVVPGATLILPQSQNYHER